MSDFQVLHAFMEGKWMGMVIRDKKLDRLSFRYDPKWIADVENFPLSLSMPLATTRHGHKVVETFLWGLLPDHEGILRQWGKKFKVSHRNPFQLLWHVGEDCAGAVQFIRSDQIENWSKKSRPGGIVWMKESEIVERIQLLLTDYSASRTNNDIGYFSLAGAQPKTAFFYDPESHRWGIPSGKIPTTHILKPATSAFDSYAENEYFCMRLSEMSGLSTASSSLQYFENYPVIIIKRYDRITASRGVIRIHQEDMCQALGRMPQQKYQSEGGPSLVDIIKLIREYSSDHLVDELRFIDSIIFNWLIGGTDAHAKNYSFLIASGGQVRLAPLYDLSSILPYSRQTNLRKAGMAMKIGGAYKLREINAERWEKCALELGMNTSKLLNRIKKIATVLPDLSHTLCKEISSQGINNPIVNQLTEEISNRSIECRKLIIK